MIFANHAHLFPKDVKESGSLDNLKKMMYECEIDRCVAFAPFNDRFEEDNYPYEANKWLYDEIKHEDNLVGFGTINFRAPDLKGQVKRIADFGFKGIKMHAPYQEFKIDGWEAFQVYEQAQEEGLFISFHCGMHWHRLDETLPILFDNVCWNFKNLKISLEHIGGSHFFNDGLAIMCNNMRGGVQPRVFAGWTSISDKDGPGGWTLTDDQLYAVIHQTGIERSMFGLDFPYNDIDDIKYDIARIKRLDISQEAKDGILGANLAKALNL